MSFLSRAGIAATRSTRVVQKRFGSHSAHHGPEAPPTEEGFTSGAFKFALIGAIGLLAWSRIDEHLTNQGEEKHPFTRYIEYYMRSEAESNRLNEKHIKQATEAAEDRKFYDGILPPPKVQLRQHDLLHSASTRGIVPGTSVEVSDVVIKHH